MWQSFPGFRRQAPISWQIIWLKSQKDELTAKIADEKLKKPSFNEKFIRFWLMKFRKFDISGNPLKRLLEFLIFVNRAAKSRSPCRFPAW